MERDTGETDEDVIERRKMLQITGKACPSTSLSNECVSKSQKPVMHAREKKKEEHVSEVHIISKRPVTTRLYGVAMGKKRKEKTKKILFFFSFYWNSGFFSY